MPGSQKIATVYFSVQVAQLPHLQNGDNNDHLIRLQHGLYEIILHAQSTENP